LVGLCELVEGENGVLSGGNGIGIGNDGGRRFFKGG